MRAISKRHSTNQPARMPRYGKIPTGAPPAKGLGARVRAGFKEDLNSCHRDDHSTSRWGSGHWSIASGTVSTSVISLDIDYQTYSSCLGIERALEKNIYLVADRRQRVADGTSRNLKDGNGVDANRGHAPRLQALFNVNHNSFPVKVNGIDRKTHGEGVDPVGGANPQSPPPGESRRVGRHETAKTGPVASRNHQIGREIGGAGTVKSVSLGAARGHENS